MDVFLSVMNFSCVSWSTCVSADNVVTLAPVTSMRTLSEITDASSAVDGV